MKHVFISLVVMLTLSSLISAQNTIIHRDSIGSIRVTTNTKDTQKSTAVTVVGVDTANTDSIDANNTYHQANRSISINGNNSDFPLEVLGDLVGGAFLIPIIAIISVFGLPVFVLFLIFFFRYKNRKARYRLVEQALAAGQPLPEEFIRENKPTDQCSTGIKNTFTGIGLFVFLWTITGELGIGAIGLMIMFMGIGQWLIGYKHEKKNKETKIEEDK